MLSVYLTLHEIAKLFYKVFELFYIPVSNVWKLICSVLLPKILGILMV